MNKIVILSTILLLGALTCSAKQTPTRTYRFQNQSVMANGRWVKVEVTDPGVYEISYDQLRQMGFSDPSRVSVYGDGGASRPQSLMSSGKRTQNDDPTQVPVFHHNGKIYFYGLGVQNPVLQGSRFQYDQQNIYTTKGHYFLADTGAPLLMESEGTASSLAPGARIRETGLDYRINDQDNLFGLENSGQYFWDYYMWDKVDNSWDVKLSYPTTNTVNASVNATLMIVGKAAPDSPDRLHVGLDDQLKEWNPVRYTINHEMMSYVNTDISIPTPADNMTKVRMKFDETTETYEAWFDYWLLNYSKDLSTAGKELRQERFGLVADGSFSTSDNGYIIVPEGSIVFDITDLRAPKLVAVENNKAYFPQAGSLRTLMVFNPEKPQLALENPVEVPNQNLHALQNENYSFMIVTVPEFRAQAEEIARLHRYYDRNSVLVVDVNECYNEFTGGNPDPNAIRMMVKMLYEKGGNRLKNVLLFGPVRSDARNILKRSQPDNFIIGIQEGGLQQGRELNMPMDFYGITDDYAPAERLYQLTMDVGVGILPVSTPREADLAASKIGSYLEQLSDINMSWLVNETMTVSCTGDGHTHDKAADSLGVAINQAMKDAYVEKGAHSYVMFDSYPEPMATQAFCDKINDGKLFNIYIGHAYPTGLGGFIHTGDITSLKNKVPTFIFFAGCDLFYPDFGGAGIGSDAVLRAPKGFIGTISSSRTAWSNSNYDLAVKFIHNLYYNGASSAMTRSASPTIGQVYAITKTDADGSRNELPFMYVGDPALTVPIPMFEMRPDEDQIQAKYLPGDMIEISGTVRTYQRQLYRNFNGGFTAKLCEPTVRRNQIKYPDFSVEYSDVKITSVSGYVTSGKFSFKIPIPKDCDRFLSDGPDNRRYLNLYLSAYNPMNRAGAGGYMKIPMAAGSEVESMTANPDEEAPTITMTHDDVIQSLTIEARDNAGLLCGIGAGRGITLTIDGKQVTGPDTESHYGNPYYETEYSVANLTPGKHTATVYATDLAGNSSAVKDLEFTVSGNGPAVTITAPTKYAIGNMTFRFAGHVSDCKFQIFGPDGKLLHDQYIYGPTVTWDCSEMAPGIYRAVVRHPNGGRVASNWLQFNVID